MYFFSDNKICAEHPNNEELKHFFSKKTVFKKYQSFLRASIFLNTPAYFYSRQVYNLNEGFDERFKLLEDKPFVVKTLKNNVDIYWVDKKTIKYRVSENSVTGKRNLKLVQEIALCNEKYVYPILKKGNLKDLVFYYILKIQDFHSTKSDAITFRGKIANKLFFHFKLYS